MVRPDLTCQDIAVSSAFYVDVLGFEVIMELGWIVTLRDPKNLSAQVSLMTHDATAPTTTDVSVELDDVDAAYRAATRAGAEVCAVHCVGSGRTGGTQSIVSINSARQSGASRTPV